MWSRRTEATRSAFQPTPRHGPPILRSSDGTMLAFGSVELAPSQRSSIRVYDFNTSQISKLPGSDEIFAPRGLQMAATSWLRLPTAIL